MLRTASSAALRNAALLCLLLLAGASSTPPEKRAGKDYAVFFYVTSFQPGWQALPDTKAEAEALKTVLETSYGFETKLVPNPTRQQIYDEIAAWNQRLTPNDQVLFFFSMHGYYDPGSELGYLVAADGLYRDEYYTTWLDYNSLRPYFARCKAKHVLVALDACYSGSFGNIERAPDHPAYDEGQDCQTQIDATFQYAARQYLCAGNKESKTPGKSLFAAKLLETLRQGSTDADGILHFDDIAYALGKVRKPEPVHGAFAGHDPGGEFVFVRKNACARQPDRDGDTVPDALDQCPDTWGSQASGCPPEGPKGDDTARDLAAWKTAKQQNTETAYRDYLRQFPQGEFKDLANQALRTFEADAARRRDETAWEVATEKNSTEGYKKYLADYPNGLHRSEAEAKIKASDPRENAVQPDNFVFVKGGTFQMGSNENDDEKPVHSVTVSDFYLSKYEVTVAEFKAFINATRYKTDAEKKGKSLVFTTDWKEQNGVNWKYDPRGNLRPSGEYNHPVSHVSWNDAVAYAEWLSKKTGRPYRLPTEAEWEYAASGGSNAHTKWAGTSEENSLTRYANADGNKDGYALTAPVGSLQANSLGLYDMSGNVWEWCSDWYGSDYYKSSSSSNPSGPGSGTSRVLRGGSWDSAPQDCRVAYRGHDLPGLRDGITGFRLARAK